MLSAFSSCGSSICTTTQSISVTPLGQQHLVALVPADDVARDLVPDHGVHIAEVVQTSPDFFIGGIAWFEVFAWVVFGGLEQVHPGSFFRFISVFTGNLLNIGESTNSRHLGGCLLFWGLYPRSRISRKFTREGRGPLQTAPRGFDPPLGAHARRRGGWARAHPGAGPVGSLGVGHAPGRTARLRAARATAFPAGTRPGHGGGFQPGHRQGARRGGRGGKRGGAFAGTPGLWPARAHGRAVPRRRGGAAAQGANGAKSGGARGRGGAPAGGRVHGGRRRGARSAGGGKKEARFAPGCVGL